MQAQFNKTNCWASAYQLNMDLPNDWGDPWVQRTTLGRMRETPTTLLVGRMDRHLQWINLR